MFAGFGLLPPGSSALSTLSPSVLTSAPFSSIGLGVGPAVRPGNTTCNLCFKTFACNSALEIHYRSHTKERPFKCTVCERGFSTKAESERCAFHACLGDSPSQWRIQRSSSSSSSGGRERPRPRPRPKRNAKAGAGQAAKKQAQAHPPPPPLPLPPPPPPAAALLAHPGYAPDFWSPFLGNMKQHMLTHKIRDMPSHLFETKPPLPPTSTANEDSSSHPDGDRSGQESPNKSDLGVKRSPPEGESMLPIAKRPPGVPKHLCHVCNKNFSSSSALQIHMRTHTGDKPFRCTICQKAFTTKGNLKVHMGTHMWSNGASRRGRRMSLDLPPIPMTPKDSEFLQRRPDLFYPYLPAPFLNGMQQKLNEISVIQSVNSGGGNGLSPPGSKFGAGLGFPGFPGEAAAKALLGEAGAGGPPPSQPGSPSPLSDKPPGSPLSLTSAGPPRRSPPGVPPAGPAPPPPQPPPTDAWEIHYEPRAGAGAGAGAAVNAVAVGALGSADEPLEVSPSPPAHVAGHVGAHAPPPAPRGEGLAA